MRLQRRFGLPVRRMRRVPGIRRMQGQKEVPEPGRIAGAKQLRPSKIGVITARIECRVALSKRLRPYSPGWGVLKRSDGEGRPCGNSRRRTALGKVPATAARWQTVVSAVPAWPLPMEIAIAPTAGYATPASRFLIGQPLSAAIPAPSHSAPACTSSALPVHCIRKRGRDTERGSESHAASLPLRVVRSNQRKCYFNLNFFPSGSVASRSRLFSEQIFATVVP